MTLSWRPKPVSGETLVAIRTAARQTQGWMAEQLGLSIRAYQDAEAASLVRPAYVLAAELVALKLAIEQGDLWRAGQQGRAIAQHYINDGALHAVRGIAPRPPTVVAKATEIKALTGRELTETELDHLEAQMALLAVDRSAGQARVGP